MDEIIVRRCFGLNGYEARVWLTLLEGGELKVSDISIISKVPKSRVYDVLASLQKKGVLKNYTLQPLSYTIESPEVIIKTVKKNVLENAQKEYDDIEKAQTLVMNDIIKIYQIGIEALKHKPVAKARPAISKPKPFVIEEPISEKKEEYEEEISEDIINELEDE